MVKVLVAKSDKLDKNQVESLKQMQDINKKQVPIM